MSITREQVQNKLKTLTEIEQTKLAYKTALETWFTEQNASQLDKTQIVNDLESYSEYSSLKQ